MSSGSLAEHMINIFFLAQCEQKKVERLACDVICEIASLAIPHQYVKRGYEATNINSSPFHCVHA